MLPSRRTLVTTPVNASVKPEDDTQLLLDAVHELNGRIQLVYELIVELAAATGHTLSQTLDD